MAQSDKLINNKYLKSKYFLNTVTIFPMFRYIVFLNFYFTPIKKLIFTAINCSLVCVYIMEIYNSKYLVKIRIRWCKSSELSRELFEIDISRISIGYLFHFNIFGLFIDGKGINIGRPISLLI